VNADSASKETDTLSEPHKEPSVNTSATLPRTIQIRPSRLAGLFVAVAIVTGVTTWSVSQFTTESHASSNPQAALGDHSTRRTLDTPTSPRPPSVLTPAYAPAVVALDAEQRVAIFGNLSATQRHLQAVTALSPEQQAAIWGNVSPTDQYLNEVTALNPEQQAAIYGNVYTTG
jgi:hypothetical protein